MKGARLPRFSLRAQIYVAVFMLALAFVLVATAGWVDAGNQAQRRAEQEIDDALDNLTSHLNGTTQDLQALGNWIVSQPDLGNLVQAHDSSGIMRYLGPWTEAGLVNSVVVCDGDGRIVASLGQSPVAAPGETIRARPGIAPALAGTRSAAITYDGAVIRQEFIWPLYSAQKSLPAGALVFDFSIDHDLLQYHARPGQHIAVANADQFVVLTLTDQQGQPLPGQRAPAELALAQQAGRATAPVILPTAVGSLLFKFRPFKSSAGAPGGMYGVGISLDGLAQDQLAQFRTWLLGLALIGLGVLAAGILYARVLTTPIRSLDTATRAMAGGDLATPIRLARNDELGDLARQMDAMRREIGQAMGAATLEKSRLTAVIQSMGAAVMITDAELRIVTANRMAEALLQSRQDQLASRRLDEIFAVNAPAGAGNGLPGLGETEIGPGNAPLIRGRFPLRARPQQVLEVVSSEIEIDRQAAGYVHLLQDPATLEQWTRAQDEFIINASHELRGPLASLRASIEVLVADYRSMTDADLHLMLDTVWRGVIRFQALVENLTDLGTIRTGRLRVKLRPARVDELIEHGVSQIQPILNARAQPIELDLSRLDGGLVLADRPRIAQVLVNLLTNASKYGPEGQPIRIAAYPAEAGDGRLIMIEVTDRGPGIPAEEQALIFQRFYRGRRAEEEGIGIGLGLALAQEIVHAHGGQIGVRSAPGAGTTFWFSLPGARG
ncbi:MAG: ATP-binding protein [Anaerolineae bacterium]